MSEDGNIRFVLSGPESSGKSTLAQLLANHFALPSAQEYARVFLESGGTYPESVEALMKLGREHLAWQRSQVPPDARCGIFDTDMLNYRVWSDVAFGHVPAELDQQFAQEHHHVHLLCEPDLPWELDPLRQFPQLEMRRKLFERYRAELEWHGIEHTIIRGNGDVRLMQAMAFLESRVANLR